VSKLSKAELDALAGEAMVDCYGRAECIGAYRHWLG
jgi:hypothetical protein